MRTSFVRYVSPTPRHTSFRKERAIVGAARGRSATAIPDLELIHPGVRDLNRETPFGTRMRVPPRDGPTNPLLANLEHLGVVAVRSSVATGVRPWFRAEGGPGACKIPASSDGCSR